MMPEQTQPQQSSSQQGTSQQNAGQQSGGQQSRGQHTASRQGMGQQGMSQRGMGQQGRSQQTTSQQITSQQTRSRQQTSQTRQARTYRTAVNIPEESRRHVVTMLNRTLADTTDLMTQAKVAHWNVKGMNFYQLHLLFDEVAETLNEHIDIVAERTTALGGEATGTVRNAAASTRIPEMPPDATTGPEYVAALVERVGIHANNLRRAIYAADDYDDEDTADLYTELSREVDKQLYFLEAHLQTAEPDAIPRNPETASEGHRPGQGQQSIPGKGGQGGQSVQEAEYRTSGGQPPRYGRQTQRHQFQSQSAQGLGEQSPY